MLTPILQGKLRACSLRGEIGGVWCGTEGPSPQSFLKREEKKGVNTDAQQTPVRTARPDRRKKGSAATIAEEEGNVHVSRGRVCSPAGKIRKKVRFAEKSLWRRDFMCRPIPEEKAGTKRQTDQG